MRLDVLHEMIVPDESHPAHLTNLRFLTLVHHFVPSQFSLLDKSFRALVTLERLVRVVLLNESNLNLAISGLYYHRIHAVCFAEVREVDGGHGGLREVAFGGLMALVVSRVSTNYYVCERKNVGKLTKLTH